MPLGAARITLLARTSVTAVAEVIRKKHDLSAVNNTIISTTQSKFGGSSGYWDGTGDYLILPGGEGADFSGDFTIECWYYPTSVASNDKLFDLRGINAVHAGGGTGTFALGDTLLIDNNSSDFRCFIDGSDRSTASSGTFSNNTWYHIALQRSGGTFNAWVNGTRYVNYAGSDDYTTVFQANQPIGANLETTSNVSNLQGYMDELRISTSARYTNGATITTPTAPFVNDENTYVLCHFNGTNNSKLFEDDNGTGRTQVSVIASGGDAQIQTGQSKFGGTSAYFDGTGDFIDAYTDWTTTGDFTIEGWIRFDSVAAPNYDDQQIIDNRQAGGFTTGHFQFRLNNGVFYAQFFGASGYPTGTTTASANTWYHWAVVRSGSDLKMYINGTQEGSTVTYTSELNANSTGFRIGAYDPGGNEVYGYIDEVRVSSTARYTTTFTPSTTAFVNDSDTVMLLHMDGTHTSTDFRDDNGKGRSPVGLIANGNAQVDTAKSKFGSASALFDGVDDGLQIADGSTFRLADGNPFTVECWVNKSASGGDAYQHIFSNNWNAASTSVRGWTFLIDNTNKPAFFWSAGTGSDQNITSSSAISTGTWTHIAVTSDGSGNIKLYIDGTQTASTASANLNESMSSEYPRIGATSTNVTLGNYSGSIDEMRVSNTVRYTTAFTPSTTPFQNDANTLLLLHMDGTDGRTTFVDDNGIY